jgi:hypothetical protein
VKTLPLPDVSLGRYDQTIEGVSGMKDAVRARYTLEFKQEAVRLVRGDEQLSAAIAYAVKIPLES